GIERHGVRPAIVDGQRKRFARTVAGPVGADFEAAVARRIPRRRVRRGGSTGSDCDQDAYENSLEGCMANALIHGNFHVATSGSIPETVSGPLRQPRDRSTRPRSPPASPATRRGRSPHPHPTHSDTARGRPDGIAGRAAPGDTRESVATRRAPERSARPEAPGGGLEADSSPAKRTGRDRRSLPPRRT